jgi:hypothetical protein
MSAPHSDPQDPGPTGLTAPVQNPPAQAPGNGSLIPSPPRAPAETNSAAAAARERAAIEARAQVALLRPRDFDTARLRILRACERPKFAKVAKYSKPVGGSKRVDGLSIRFAEEVRVLWGNLDVSAFLVFDDETRRVYRVQGVDLETNASDSVDIMVEKQVERKFAKEGDEVLGERINSKGEKVFLIVANEDALLTKVNNLIAKARRNVILTLIPGDIKEEAEEQIDATVKKRDAEDPEGAKKDVMDGFFSVGVMPKQIAEFLGHGLETINPAELHMLRRIFVGLRDGESTWTEVMADRKAGVETKPEDKKKGTAGLKDQIKKQGSSKESGGTGQGPQDVGQTGPGSAGNAGNAGDPGSLQLISEESEEDIRRQEREMLEREEANEKAKREGAK